MVALGSGHLVVVVVTLLYPSVQIMDLKVGISDDDDCDDDDDDDFDDDDDDGDYDDDEIFFERTFENYYRKLTLSLCIHFIIINISIYLHSYLSLPVCFLIFSS